MLYVNYISVIHVLKKNKKQAGTSPIFLSQLWSLPLTPYLAGSCCWVAKLCLTLCDPMGCSPQAPLSIGFTREECWSGLPFPTPGIFLIQGWTCASCIGRWILYHWALQEDNCKAQMQFAKYQLQQDKFEHRRVDMRPKANSLIIGRG